MPEKKQMRIGKFSEEYDIPRTTIMELVYREHFPAYKIGNRWYVDIPKFLKWRDLHNAR